MVSAERELSIRARVAAVYNRPEADFASRLAAFQGKNGRVLVRYVNSDFMQTTEDELAILKRVFVEQGGGAGFNVLVDLCGLVKKASIGDVRDLVLSLAKVANPACQVVGISVNTQHLNEADAKTYLATVEAEFALPAVDPFRHGAESLVDALAALG